MFLVPTVLGYVRPEVSVPQLLKIVAVLVAPVFGIIDG